MMKIIYHSIKSAFGKLVRAVKAVRVKAHNANEVVKRAAEICTDFTEDQIRVVLAAVAAAVCEFVAAGEAVKTDLLSIYPGVTGNVKDSTTKTSGDLKAKLNFRAGLLLLEAISKVTFEIDTTYAPVAAIVSVFDLSTGLTDLRLTALRPIGIKGRKIKIAGKDPSVGLYFRNCDTGESVKVPAEECVVNNPSNVAITVPKLPRGRYNIVCVTQYSGQSHELKEPRTITYDKDLIVA